MRRNPPAHCAFSASRFRSTAPGLFGKFVANKTRESTMDLGSIIIFLIVGAIAGWLAGKIVKGGGFGLVGNIVVGVIGAVVAGFILPRLGFTVGGGFLTAIIHSTIGAIIVLVLIRIIKQA